MQWHQKHFSFGQTNIVEVLYVCTDAAEQLIIRAKCGTFSEFRTSETASAGFSVTIQHTLFQQSLGLPYLFRCSCDVHASLSQLKRTSLSATMICHTFFNVQVQLHGPTIVSSNLLHN